MRNLVIALLATAAISSTFVGCSKYEEGPSLSFRTAKNRVANTWKIESVVHNGVDLTKLPQYSTQQQFWTSDGGYTQTYINPTNGIGERILGNWTLQDDAKKVAVVKYNQVTGNPESTVVYVITKLYNKCMWLRSADNTWEYHLVPVN